jgi:RNA polymerase-binding transcription factor
MKSTGSTTAPPSSTRYEELRSGLETRRREVEAAVRSRLTYVREERASADHFHALEDGEVSDVDLQEDLELAVVQMKLETLKQIDAALIRLDAGFYGRCIECGDDIAAARLRALPFAVRCLECEGAREMATGRRRHLERDHNLQTDAALRFR